MANACTWWPDGWPAWMGGTGDEWRHCCVAHDAAAKSIADDLAIGSCVADISPAMGLVMTLGVLTLGTVYVLVRRRLRRRK